jgi:hypothetical protein
LCAGPVGHRDCLAGGYGNLVFHARKIAALVPARRTDGRH